jgi:hypothetical protein
MEANAGAATKAGAKDAIALGASNFMERDPALSIERTAPSFIKFEKSFASVLKKKQYLKMSRYDFS